MESPTCYTCCEKEILGWIREKMAIQELALKGGRFFASGSIVARNGTLVCNNSCVLGRDYSIAVGNDF
jgi:hypothetical protein